MTQHRHKTNKRRKWPIVLIIIGSLLVLIIAAVIAGGIYLTGDLKTVNINKDNLDLVHVTPEMVQREVLTNVEHDIVNIAFFGVDTRDTSASFGDQNRSDSIIIVSVDKTANTIKIISVLRDSKVPIEGHDPQKINAAYKYGMAPLAIKTLNQNFKLDIEDYVSVDFGALENVIDLLGGVDIRLDKYEAELVNQYADGVMGYKGYDAVEGNNTLNGAQAVSYSRIRSIDSDYYRAGRQQTVLKSLFNKLRGKPVSEYPELIRTFMSCVETSMSYTDIFSLATGINVRTAGLKTYTMPDPDYEPGLWGGIEEDTGSWVWIYDLDLAAERIHKIIYGGDE